MEQALPRWPLLQRLTPAKNSEEMRVAASISLMLHLGMVLLFIFGLPILFKPKTFQENVITVELLPVSAMTNVKLPKPAPVKKAKNKPKPSAATPPKVSLSEPVREKAPKIMVKPKPIQEKKVEPLPKELIKPKVNPKEEKPKEELVKKDEPKVDGFAAVLKSVEAMQQTEDKSDAKDDGKADKFDKVEDFLANMEKDNYHPGVPLSLSEKDAIRQQIMRNWTVLGGARDAQDMAVTLEISLAKDGTVTGVEIDDKARYAGNKFFRAMADSAVRAVYKSSPLKHLPEDKYEGSDGWQHLKLNFDPREMLY